MIGALLSEYLRRRTPTLASEYQSLICVAVSVFVEANLIARVRSHGEGPEKCSPEVLV